jgi:hypothetical protein
MPAQPGLLKVEANKETVPGNLTLGRRRMPTAARKDIDSGIALSAATSRCTRASIFGASVFWVIPFDASKGPGFPGPVSHRDIETVGITPVTIIPVISANYLRLRGGVTLAPVGPRPKAPKV